MSLGWLDGTSCLDLWIPGYTTLKNEALAWESIAGRNWFQTQRSILVVSP